eukprot:2208151-Amphidinium_carterae.1
MAEPVHSKKNKGCTPCFHISCSAPSALWDHNKSSTTGEAGSASVTDKPALDCQLANLFDPVQL